MKFLALWACRTLLLVIAISASVFADIPIRPPTTAPQPRKRPVAQAGSVQKVAPKTKAGKALEKANEKADKEARKRAKKAKKHSK
jgi:hypothetical protein